MFEDLGTPAAREAANNIREALGNFYLDAADNFETFIVHAGETLDGLQRNASVWVEETKLTAAQRFSEISLATSLQREKFLQIARTHYEQLDDVQIVAALVAIALMFVTFIGFNFVTKRSREQALKSVVHSSSNVDTVSKVNLNPTKEPEQNEQPETKVSDDHPELPDAVSEESGEITSADEGETTLPEDLQPQQEVETSPIKSAKDSLRRSVRKAPNRKSLDTKSEEPEKTPKRVSRTKPKPLEGNSLPPVQTRRQSSRTRTVPQHYSPAF